MRSPRITSESAGGGEQRDAAANPERASVPPGASSAAPAPAVAVRLDSIDALCRAACARIRVFGHWSPGTLRALVGGEP